MAAKKKDEIQLPLGPLKDLLASWRKAKVRGMVIGGLVFSLLGEARYTKDVDAVVLVPENKWRAFLERAESFGFVARYNDPLEFARRNRILLLHHKKTHFDVYLWATSHMRRKRP